MYTLWPMQSSLVFAHIFWIIFWLFLYGIEPWIFSLLFSLSFHFSYRIIPLCPSLFIASYIVQQKHHRLRVEMPSKIYFPYFWNIVIQISFIIHLKMCKRILYNTVLYTIHGWQGGRMAALVINKQHYAIQMEERTNKMYIFCLCFWGIFYTRLNSKNIVVVDGVIGLKWIELNDLWTDMNHF